jgi:hypothetical protein
VARDAPNKEKSTRDGSSSFAAETQVHMFPTAWGWPFFGSEKPRNSVTGRVPRDWSIY